MLPLDQAITLFAGDFALQVITPVAEQFVLVEFQALQVSATVGQPADAVAVRAGAGDALVEGVVLEVGDAAAIKQDLAGWVLRVSGAWATRTGRAMSLSD
ncbi:hypothetical protein LK03_11675 [Pseudomonas cremoricolorata]|uniref:Uncharacterized protein n=1 Tax=Pseudomonas cremoricolorata TaxID=157783 RepID=A0A089WRV2_9PSED|nr:hypothetical protein LK03_11675 [Pseudomonas cremoricolorata]